MAPVGITAQEGGPSCPVSEKVNEKVAGSGQGPAAAPFGNDSASKSKGWLLLFH